MKCFKKVLKLFSLDIKTILLLMETFIYLGWARILLFLPFTKLAPSLGIQMQETPHTQKSANKAILKKISQAIEIISNHTFWESKCFVKAIAGMKMLERRRIDSTIYLGTAKNDAGELVAHAWLRSGRVYITGADVMSKFTVVGKFAKQIDE